jgi:hypothetical protein
VRRNAALIKLLSANLAHSGERGIGLIGGGKKINPITEGRDQYDG